MDLIFLLAAGWAWNAVVHPASIAPNGVPAVVAAVWQVQAPQTEHPWERRLRQLELDNARSKAFAEQATTEAKEIIKNRTDRLEILERKLRDIERAAVEHEDPMSKADEAIKRAEANSDKIHEVSSKVEAVANPWSWESLIRALGGPAVVLGILLPLVLGNRNSTLKRELEERGVLPGRTTDPGSERADDEVPLRTGRLSLRDL